jgi:hypothetical protein
VWVEWEAVAALLEERSISIQDGGTTTLQIPVMRVGAMGHHRLHSLQLSQPFKHDLPL